LLIRNLFYLPQFKSSLCNYDYLCGVKEGKIFCPKTTELRIRVCFTPPTKQVVIAAIMKLARAQNPPLNMGFDEASKATPDKSWSLWILSTLNPDHPFFAKGYVAPRKPKKLKVGASLNNDDGFFSGLEGIQSRYDMKRGGNQNKRVNGAIDRV
jgi:hypothetical protein